MRELPFRKYDSPDTAWAQHASPLPQKQPVYVSTERLRVAMDTHSQHAYLQSTTQYGEQYV